MSYYDSAALLGGWASPFTLYDRTTAPDWGTEGVKTIPSDFMKKLTAHLKDSPYFFNDEQIQTLVGLAYAYDSAVMLQNKEMMETVASGIDSCGIPNAKKALNYIRRFVHRGASKKRKRTKAERYMEIAMSKHLRDARMHDLREAPWWGSDPYVPGGRHRYQTYKNLATRVARRPKREILQDEAHVEARAKRAATLAKWLDKAITRYPLTEFEKANLYRRMYPLPKEEEEGVLGDVMRDV